MAKVNQRIIGIGKEYVLCLYYKDDSRKYELAEKYQEKMESNIDTGNPMKAQEKENIQINFLII